MDINKLYNRENCRELDILSPHFLENNCRRGTKLVIVNGVETTYCEFDSYSEGEILFKWSITFNEANDKVRAKINYGRVSQERFPAPSVYLWPDTITDELFEHLGSIGLLRDKTIAAIAEYYTS